MVERCALALGQSSHRSELEKLLALLGFLTLTLLSLSFRVRGSGELSLHVRWSLSVLLAHLRLVWCKHLGGSHSTFGLTLMIFFFRQLS